MRLSKQQIAWWESTQDLDFKSQYRNEHVPAETPMTIRGSGREVNIADLIKAFRGAILIATVENKKKAEALSYMYNQLLRDMKVDPDYIRHISTGAARSHFSTQIGHFSRSAPYFKAYFEGCNKSSMRYLLIKTRLFFASNKEWARQSFRLRNRSTKVPDPVPGTIRITDELRDRLWPLDKDVYEAFARLYIRRRLGPKGGCFLFYPYSHWGIKVRLTRHGCEVVKAESTGSERQDVSWRVIVPKSKEIRSLNFDTGINKFGKIERALASGQTLRLHEGKIVVP